MMCRQASRIAGWNTNSGALQIAVNTCVNFEEGKKDSLENIGFDSANLDQCLIVPKVNCADALVCGSVLSEEFQAFVESFGVEGFGSCTDSGNVE